jgi:hypothetical protein
VSHDPDDFMCHTQTERLNLMREHDEKIQKYVMNSCKMLIDQHERNRELAVLLRKAAWGTTLKDFGVLGNFPLGQIILDTLSIIENPILCRPQDNRRCGECIECWNEKQTKKAKK